MTGNLGFERSLAGETLLVDLHTGDWSWDLIGSLDLPGDMFPPIIPAGTIVGGLSDSMARHLGLTPGLPVVSGGGDTQSGLLGMGAAAPGQLGVIAGTTTPIQLVLSEPVIDQQYRLWTGLHIIPDHWVLESNVGQTGVALEWIAGLMYPAAKDPVLMLDAQASRSAPGSQGITSSLGASLFNANEMGIPIGNITFSHMLAIDDPQRARHVARAVLEGMGYGVRANIEQLLEVARIDLPPIHLGGGMARSKLFAEILSSVSKTEVTVLETSDVSALGAAICAAVGAGMFPNLQEAASKLNTTSRTYEPHPDQAVFYQEQYANWLELQGARAEADLVAGDIALGALMDQPAKSAELGAGAFKPRVLVTAQMSTDSLEALREFADVTHEDYRQEMRLLSGIDLVEELQGYHVLVTEIDIVDIDALKDLPDLRLIICCRGNPVNVDIEACTQLGIPVLNTPGRNADAVADLTVACMLMLARKLPEADRFLRQPGIEAGDMGRMGMAYETLQGHELWNKMVGLIGLGAIGKKVAQRLKPFGVTICACDPYLSEYEAALAEVELMPLDELLKESDFISLHAPATAQTRPLINEQKLSLIKPGAFLINTARAALVDETALYNSLKNGKLAGAAIDVFSVEPPGSDHHLLSLPNVIATPHIGGNTYQVAAHQGWIIKDQIERLLHAEHPDYILNPETLENFHWSEERKSLSEEEILALASKPGPGVSDLDIETHEDEKPSQPEEAASPTPQSTQHKQAGIFSRVRNLITNEEKEDSPMPQTVDRQETSEKVALIIKRFIENAASDQALQNFSKNRTFLMYFYVTDLKQEFYLDFNSGHVSGATRKPYTPPDLTLKMKADILDGMFTGRLNATRAAMTGKIAFSGDTRKAMSMQKIQKDLTRLYSQAREQVGDPGDLSSISSEPERVKTTPAAQTIEQVPTTTVGDERDELIQVLNELYSSGLITSTGGNISLRTSAYEEQAWITPSQIFKGDLRADMMVRIDMHGERLDDEALPASSERMVHCAIYRRRPDIQAIVHTHAPNTTILMLAGLPFVPISTETAFIGDIPVVPFIMPGTEQLSNEVALAIGDGVAVFMQNHGLVVGGSSLRRAADITEIIETTSEKLIMLALLGKDPPTLPDDIVEELSQYKDLMA